MKKLVILLGAAAVMAQAGTVLAESLEDVLKQKGMITEEEYKRIVKSTPAVSYKPGQGITLTTADGNFSTTIGGYVQARYTFLNSDDVNDDKASSVGMTTSPGGTSSQFEVKRAKLVIGGHAFSKDLTYNVTANFSNIAGGSTKNGGLLENAFINYKWRDELQVRAGQEKVQFGRQWLISATDLQFVDVSHVTAAFAPTYDTGVRLFGKLPKGLVTYSLAVSGGLGQNYVRATRNNALSARITANPFGEMKNTEADLEQTEKPLVSFGANYYRNTITETEYSTSSNNSLGYLKSKAGWFALNKRGTLLSGESVNISMLGLDAAFKWRGLSISGEYMWGEGDAQQSKYGQRAMGFYAQAGYMVIPKTLEVAYRYAYLDPNINNNTLALNDHWIENSVAVSWYIREHYLKLQADYTAIHKQRNLISQSTSVVMQPTDDNQARVQLQLVF
ncbi:porin [Geobacter sp. FeAm09]|uniref:porin n=1 Tax=Geobacter sp. FeAm09 TaxID=2597769 RepID=UPI0011EDEC9B|nr:porin [Geobacter sp. FeAm09]QEM68589.1 porin [Geobacter sp. FeAm09]